MRKFVKSTSILLAFILIVGMSSVFGMSTLSVNAYGEADGKLIITHININNPEGAGVIITPTTGETVSFGFEWWVLISFDWDDEEEAFVVTRVQTNTGASEDKSNTEMPEKGFAYAVNIGNNYPELGNPNKPNYQSEKVILSYNYAKKLKVGTKAYLYGVDVKNDIIDVHGDKWYLDTFATNSYIKIGTPDPEGTPYNPNESEEMVIQHSLNVTHINTYGASAGMSIIFTRDYGTDIFGSSETQTYPWWKTAVFEWNDVEDCYTITSLCLVAGSNYQKQVVIPEDGFVLAVIDGGEQTNYTFERMNRLKIGAKAYVYGADLAEGTVTSSAKVCVNIPDTEQEEYKPSLIGERLDTPVFTNMDEKRTVITAQEYTIEWSAVEGATGYVVNINDSLYVPDGRLIVNNEQVTDTFCTIPDGTLEIGGEYTVSVYALGTDRTSSMISRAILAVISEEAFNSNLKEKTIVAFGDSLTANASWVNRLAGRFGSDVINSGVGGNSTNQAKARFNPDVLANDPDIVIINFGMNDQAQSIATNAPITSLAKYTENLDYFAKTLTESGIEVIFVTPNDVCTEKGYYKPSGLDYGTDNMLDYCDAMRKVALKYNCGIVDINYECDFEDLKQFCNAGDGIHQSVYGHQRYAELIGDYLAAVYDDKNSSSVLITPKDEAGNQIGEPYSVYGAIGSHIIIPAKNIQNYISVSEPVGLDFKETVQSITCTYISADSTIELNENSAYEIKDDLIYTNGSELSAEDVLSEIKTSRVVCVPHKGNSVGTGSKIQLKVGDTVIKEFTVVLRGDTNGDGKINSQDYLLLKRYILETYILENEFESSCDVDGNGNIRVTDYLYLKRHLLDTFNIFEK